MAHVSKDDEDNWLNLYEEGDETARDQMILAYIPMADHQATNALRRNNMPMSILEDLQQSARMGLVKALDTFDPKRGCRFSTYAHRCIRAEISDAIKEERKHLLRHELADRLAPDDYCVEPPLNYSVHELDLACQPLLYVLEGKLTQREFDVCTLLLEDENMNNAEVGRRLGISRERVRQILRCLRLKLELRSILQN